MKRNRDSNSTLVLCLEGLLVLSSPIRTHYLNRNQQTTPVADLNLLFPVTIRSPAYPIYRLNLLMASAYTIGPPDLSSGISMSRINGRSNQDPSQPRESTNYNIQIACRQRHPRPPAVVVQLLFLRSSSLDLLQRTLSLSLRAPRSNRTPVTIIPAQVSNDGRRS